MRRALLVLALATGCGHMTPAERRAAATSAAVGAAAIAVVACKSLVVPQRDLIVAMACAAVLALAVP